MLSVHKLLFFSSFLFSLCSVWMAISRKKAKKKTWSQISFFVGVFVDLWKEVCYQFLLRLSACRNRVCGKKKFKWNMFKVRCVNTTFQYALPLILKPAYNATMLSHYICSQCLAPFNFDMTIFFSFYLFFRFFVTYILSKHFYHIFRWKVIWLKTTYTWSFRIYFDWLTMR